MLFYKRCVAAVAVALGALSLGSCAEDRPDQEETEPVTEHGSLKLPLETTGQSGTRYRLVNAIFEIRDVRTGRLEAQLSSEDEPFSSIISTELDPSNYTVTLLPGWSIQRLGGGMTPSPFPEPAPFPEPVPFPQPTPPFPGPTASGSAPAPTSAPAVPTTSPGPGTGGFGNNDDEPMVPAGGEPGAGGSSGGVTIGAVLESDAVQFFSIFANEDSFVFYTFRVGDDIISFEPGRVNIIFEVIEDDVPGGGVCDDPVAARRPSVMETNVEAVSVITLRQMFDAMAANEGFPTDGELLYQQVIDSYATADQGRLADAVHCGDEVTNGQPSLNGFRIDCNRQERFQFDNLDQWFATAFVNRLDLAAANGAHCGQQRVIFANNVQGRMFFILEAQIPNPAPELGALGCTPLAEFWAEQVSLSDPAERGLRLRDAFLTGSPELSAQGFGPFATASNFTVGSGQIRTNNFDDFIWTLREFKLAVDGSDLKAVPFPVAESPNGDLWNDTLALAQGPDCRDAFVDAVSGILSDNPAQMSFVVPHECKNAESRNDGSEDYVSHLLNGNPAGFLQELDDAGLPFGLSAIDIGNRARFSGSCIGCHEEAIGLPLGNGVTAPFSNGFVHVAEFAQECPGGLCFTVSQALADVFLPHRLSVLENLVEVPLPPECEPTDGDGGVGPVDPFPTPMPPAPSTPAPSPAPVGSPVPVDGPELPSAALSADELAELDAEEREGFGDSTLGGQDARTSH